jgi:hypothetical protein
MSGWYGSMPLGAADLGHPHETDGDFYRAHELSQEQAAGMSDAELHPPVSTSNGSRMPGWANTRNAKLAGMGLVAGAVVGVVIVPFLANRKIISKSKTWQVAAAGAAFASPIVAAYA